MSDERLPKIGDVVHYCAVGSHKADAAELTVTKVHGVDCVSGTFKLFEGDGLHTVQFLRLKKAPDFEKLTHTHWWEWPRA